jgi:hypothetical protein
MASKQEYEQREKSLPFSPVRYSNIDLFLRLHMYLI